MICSRRTQAAYQYAHVTGETEWIRAKKALEYLDLDDRNSTLFGSYKKYFLSNEVEEFQIPWIPTSGKGFPVDDCRVLREWFNSDSLSMFFHLCMKEREPDWIGRNLFLVYLMRKLESDYSYLESGRNSVRFMNIATLCGFHEWKESLIDDDRTISDYVFNRIYPFIVKGLFQAREDRPWLARVLLDMFYVHARNLFMFFEKIPDAEHLQFLLDVALGSGFDIWGVENYMQGFSYLSVIVEYVIQNRYDLVMTLLRFGLQLREEPIYWMQSIYMGLWGSDCDFAVTPQFKEMLYLLFIVHEIPYLPPEMIQENLTNFYRQWRTSEGIDDGRGRYILTELINAFETCGISFS